MLLINIIVDNNGKILQLFNIYYMCYKMVSGLTSGLGIAGIILIIIGIIMAVIGIVLLIARQSTSTEWYIWALLIGGIVLGIIGGIMLAIALAYAPAAPMTPLLSSCAPVDQCATPIRYTSPPVQSVQYVQQIPQQPTVQYVQQLPQQVQQAPVQYIQQAPLSVAPTVGPRRVVSQQVQEIGPGNFDPDPEVSVVETRPAPQRVSAVGPYGPNGEQRRVTGVYQAPQQRVYTTEDITPHTVVNNAMGVQPGFNGAIAAPVMYRNM